MGKIYFVAEIHCGEDVVTSPEIYNMKMMMERLCLRMCLA